MQAMWLCRANPAHARGDRRQSHSQAHARSGLSQMSGAGYHNDYKYQVLDASLALPLTDVCNFPVLFPRKAVLGRTYQPGFRGCAPHPRGRPSFYELHWIPAACPECEGSLQEDEHCNNYCVECGLIVFDISLDSNDPQIEEWVEKVRAFQEYMKATRRQVYNMHGDPLFSFSYRDLSEDLAKMQDLLSDGKPRTYAEIDKAFSWPHRTAERTIKANVDRFNVAGGGRRGKPVKVTSKVKSIASGEV
jgi:hypothetical protein